MRFFPVHGVNTALLSTYKCGIMLVLKGWYFRWIPCTAVHYLAVSFLANCALVTRTNRVVVFERNLHLLTSRVAPLSTASARSGRIVPENSRTVLVIRSER